MQLWAFFFEFNSLHDSKLNRFKFQEIIPTSSDQDLQIKDVGTVIVTVARLTELKLNTCPDSLMYLVYCSISHKPNVGG